MVHQEILLLKVKCNNSTMKVNITNIVKDKGIQPRKWCQVVHEAAYKKNISLHRAIQKTPYYVLFGKEPNKECHDAKTTDQQPQLQDLKNRKWKVTDQSTKHCHMKTAQCSTKPQELNRRNLKVNKPTKK